MKGKSQNVRGYKGFGMTIKEMKAKLLVLSIMIILLYPLMMPKSFACSLNLSGLPSSSPFKIEMIITNSVHDPKQLNNDLSELFRFLERSMPDAIHSIKKTGHEPVYFVASWKNPDRSFEGRSYVKDMYDGKQVFVGRTFPTDIKMHYIKSFTVMMNTEFGGITHLLPNCAMVIPGEEGYYDEDKYPQVLHEQLEPIKKLGITLISGTYDQWKESRVDKMAFGEEADSKFGRWALFTDIHSYSMYVQNSSDETIVSQNLNPEITYGVVAIMGASAAGAIFAVRRKRK